VCRKQIYDGVAAFVSLCVCAHDDASGNTNLTRADTGAPPVSQVSGLLHVQRAPGMLVMQAVSEGHDFNWETMDVSHTVCVNPPPLKAKVTLPCVCILLHAHERYERRTSPIFTICTPAPS
jgi:hypothetical protein